MQTVRVDQLAEVLAQAVRDGMRLEQERIIKLLEERKSQVEHSLDRLGAMGKEYWEIQVRILEMSKAIELIKGENN